MDAFINVIKKDPKVQIKINDMLDRYKRFLLKRRNIELGLVVFQNH